MKGERKWEYSDGLIHQVAVVLQMIISVLVLYAVQCPKMIASAMSVRRVENSEIPIATQNMDLLCPTNKGGHV